MNQFDNLLKAFRLTNRSHHYFSRHSSCEWNLMSKRHFTAKRANLSVPCRSDQFTTPWIRFQLLPFNFYNKTLALKFGERTPVFTSNALRPPGRCHQRLIIVADDFKTAERIAKDERNHRMFYGIKERNTSYVHKAKISHIKINHGWRNSTRAAYTNN